MLVLGRRTSATAALIAALSLLAALSGCGAAGGAAVAPTATTTIPSATATSSGPAALPTLPTTQIASGACGQYYPANVPLTPAGGLVVTQYSGLGNLAYPHVQIPSSQQAAPIAQPPLFTGNFTANDGSVVNPLLQESGGGYTLVICNPSSQAHVVSAVQASIARITPFTDQLGEWVPCTGAYHPGSPSVGGGCGGADFENEYLHAPFSANATVGASVATKQTGANSSDASGGINLGPLPVTLNPGQAMSIEVGVTQPSAAGYYTYAFTLTVDSTSTGVVAYSQTTLLAPAAHPWSGSACQTPAMQAQIAQEPTPTANGGFICPGS